MTAESAQYVHPTPQVIPARVTIEHLQLRDILQPSSSKGKCLFINRLKVDEVDFNQPQKGPTTFCTLDFRANCLVTAHGLLAAGGQASELAIRSLSSPSSSGSSSTALEVPARQTPWLLRTPTGGSINNAISIQVDPPSPTDDRRHGASAYSPTPLAGPSRHRHPKSSMSPRRPSQIEGMWLRDEPRGRLSGGGAHGMARRHRQPLLRDDHDRGVSDMDVDTGGDLISPYPSTSSASRSRRPARMTVEEEIEAESAAVAAAYGFIRSPSQSRAAVRKCSEDRDDALSNKKGRSGRETVGRNPRTSPQRGPTRIYVCNNDQSLKIYKLKPPSGLSSSLESGLPSLSRAPALEFPTAVNHSSFSPDGQTLVAVGDTPDVFLYHRCADGTFSRIATYRATSDASFSTSWHPDGTKFAVASQDGVVSVWDVRSQAKLAELRTHQGAGIGVDVSGLGGANGAARVVKFSPCGRYLAFTEHRLYFHIYDTLTYSRGQRVAIPLSVDGLWSGTPASAAARHSETPSTFPESRERRSSNHAVGGLGRWSLDRASSLAEHSNRRSPTITSRLSRLTSSTESAAETLRHASRDLLALQERMANRSTSTYGANIGRDWLSLGAGGTSDVAYAADDADEPPSLGSRHNNIDDQRRNVIERIALERALAEGWRPEPAEDPSEWLLEDDAQDENSGSSRAGSDEDAQAGEEGGAGSSGSHGASTQRLFFPHPSDRSSSSGTREQDRNREPAHSRLGDREAPAQPPRAPRLPILRAYSALYSPLGPLGGWGHSTVLGPSPEAFANASEAVARAVRANAEAGDEDEYGLDAGRGEHRQRDRTRERERERGVGTSRRSGTSAFNSTTLTGSNASPLATSGSGAMAGAIHAHRDEALNRLLFPEQDAFQNIAGICWDADGECIYVASERLVARYMVSDLRRSMEWGEVR